MPICREAHAAQYLALRNILCSLKQFIDLCINAVRKLAELVGGEQIFEADDRRKQISLPLRVIALPSSDTQLVMKRHCSDRPIPARIKVIKPFVVGTYISHARQQIEHTCKLLHRNPRKFSSNRLLHLSFT